MAARRKTKTYKLGVSRARADVAKSIKKGMAALVAGRKAVQRARRKHDAAALATNLAAVQDTRWALRNLNASLNAIDDACPDQILNIDPTFEG